MERSDPRTTPAVLDRMARELAGHEALITEERTFTFAQLRDEVRRTAAAMIGLGVAGGRSGGNLVAEHLALGGRESGHPLRRCSGGPTEHPLHRRGGRRHPGSHPCAAADRDGPLPRHRPGGRPRPRGAAGSAPHRAGSLDIEDGTWDDFLAGPQAPMSEVDARAATLSGDDVSDILFTSGTTGRSKGVLCAHRQSLAAPAAWAACGQLTSADRYLCINPFFHNFGFKAAILACLQTGATLIPQLTFDPEQAMRMVEQHRVTVLPGPPTIFQMLLDHPALAKHDLSSLRFAVTGAATIPVVLIERMQAELDFDIVLTAYGLTEATGFGTMCRAEDDAVTVATTCGRPIADFELRIDTPDDETGEVLLRGPNVMLGYLDDPEATAGAIDADGWLHTGDIGTVDAAGNLRITDRLKDMTSAGASTSTPPKSSRSWPGCKAWPTPR